MGYEFAALEKPDTKIRQNQRFGWLCRGLNPASQDQLEFVRSTRRIDPINRSGWSHNRRPASLAHSSGGHRRNNFQDHHATFLPFYFIEFLSFGSLSSKHQDLWGQVYIIMFYS